MIANNRPTDRQPTYIITNRYGNDQFLGETVAKSCFNLTYLTKFNSTFKTNNTQKKETQIELLSATYYIIVCRNCRNCNSILRHHKQFLDSGFGEVNTFDN